MYQGQLILYVKAETEDQCQARLDELEDFVESVKAEGFIPGFYDIDTNKPDKVQSG